MDFEENEIDMLFSCQKFTPHDCFWLWALLGRLFFMVGELDSNEMTLFFQGIGGCGKTTIIKTWQKFWPAHLRGIMSSNMQEQFGMSSLEKAYICFCGEVSANLKIVQEEWQDAVSGAEVSLARKNKEPTTFVWKAQMLWVGNYFPIKFENRELQVSRRLSGVRMKHPIHPRDGSIMKRIEKKLGSFQRKALLAYFECLRVHGSVDPMSNVEGMPPAFREFYEYGKTASNPMEAFLCSDQVQEEKDNYVLMEELKQRYQNFCSVNNLYGRGIKWSQDLYNTPFAERGYVVEHVAKDKKEMKQGIGEVSGKIVVRGLRFGD